MTDLLGPEPHDSILEVGTGRGYQASVLAELSGRVWSKPAVPEREIWVLVGDGSYLMMNSEIATSVMLDKKLNIVVLDNGGLGCIERL
jgi:TPP-dependent trihydroxycyclohexane-1,2-dione (THcHDO) dehydratase